MLKYGLNQGKRTKRWTAPWDLKLSPTLSLSKLLTINGMIRLPRPITFQLSAAANKVSFLV
jgi:hypothetical protein